MKEPIARTAIMALLIKLVDSSTEGEAKYGLPASNFIVLLLDL